MADPHTRLTGFVNYVVASPRTRPAAVKQALGTDYHVSHDFYLRMRSAIAADRRTTRDGAAVDAAAANATTKKRTAYRRLATNWPAVLGRWASSHPTAVERVDLDVAGLQLTISPAFAELHPNGTTEVVVVRYPAPLSNRHLDLIVRLIQRAYAPTVPNLVATVVDLQEPKLRSSEGRTDLSGLDPWIDTEAAGLAYALRAA